jgi:hypothetical protein
VEGSALSYVTITAVTPDKPTFSPPPGGSIIGLTYNLGPEGSTFDPPISISLLYSPAQLPSEEKESRLVVGYWDDSSQQWVPLGGSQVDIANHAITAPLNHFSIYAILTLQPAPAAFTLGQLTVSPSEVTIGEAATAVLEDLPAYPDRTGPGGQMAVSATAVNDIDSESLNVKTRPSPAAFDIGNIQIDPAVVEEGQDVLIAAWVTNAGETSGDYDITLKINGIASQTSRLNLPGKSNQQISFRIRPDSSGRYDVDINGVKDNLQVNARLQAWYLIVLGLAGLLSFAVAFTMVLWRARKNGLSKA